MPITVIISKPPEGKRLVHLLISSGPETLPAGPPMLVGFSPKDATALGTRLIAIAAIAAAQDEAEGSEPSRMVVIGG